MDINKLFIVSQNRLFQPFELLLNTISKSINGLHPIWIIGAPRSGTTLTYQLFCSYFNSYYLTNRVAQRYRIVLSTRIFERLYNSNPVPTTFLSNYGRTKSSNDPHEGGQFFYQFFPVDDPYTTSLENDKQMKFKKILENLAVPHDLFISKNTTHSLRIRALAEVFPKSKFIWVQRELEDNVHSILRAREKLKIGKDEWWGIRPPSWENTIKKPLIERVIWQVSQTEETIERDLAKIQAPYINVSYKTLCENPLQILNTVAEKFSLKKYIREEFNIPKSFSYSTAPQDELLQRVKNSIITFNETT